MDSNHLILSLKWTHKKDKWLTFWRSNSSGYCWFKEWCGLYDINEIRSWIDNEQEKAVNAEMIKNYWMEVEYEGVKRIVLPNTEEVREIIGIGIQNLKRKYPS